MIIFGLVSFISKQSSDVVLEKKINKIYGDFLSSTNIQHIANSCLDKTTNEALLLVGLQGGRIYDYQIKGGYHIPSFYDVIPYNYSTSVNPAGAIYNVSYGIKAIKAQRAGAPPVEPADYPYTGSLVSDVTESSVAAFFADSNPTKHLFANVSEPRASTLLPALCNLIGPNNPYTRLAEISCETTSPKSESIQEYIKKYIEQNTKTCINFTLTQTSAYNISAGNASSEVLIGEDDLIVFFTYPIEISIKNKPPITKYLDFNIRPEIRLKMLHEIASHLVGFNPSSKLISIGSTITIYSESNDIFFDITKDDSNDCYGAMAPCRVDGISVSKLQDYCLSNLHCNFSNRHYNYSDLFVIEDDNSIIDGKPYRFQFAIENRRPALDLIDESVGPDKYYYRYLNSTYGVPPNGLNLTELYSNNAAGEHPKSNNYNILVNPGGYVEIYPLGVDPDEEGLTYDCYIQSGGVGSIINWISSKDINFTNAADATLLINVSDNEGLYDYQNVTVRVG